MGQSKLGSLAVVMTGAQVAHLPQAVVDALEYVPRLEPGVWLQVRSLVIEVISGLDIELASYARTTIRAVARLGAYCVSIGRAPTLMDALTPEIVESFAARERATAASRASGAAIVSNDVARLRTIGRTLRPDLAWPINGEPGSKRIMQPPYTDAECAAFAASAGALQARADVRAVRGVLALGLGAGLAGGELHRVRTDDVSIDDAGTTWVAVRAINGHVTRTVPVAMPWNQVLTQALATTTGPLDRYVVPVTRRSSSLSDVLSRIARRNRALTIDTHRLRTTWLSQRIHAGVPLHTLMTYAGLTSAETLTQIARMLPAQPVDAAVSELTAVVRG